MKINNKTAASINKTVIVSYLIRKMMTEKLKIDWRVMNIIN
jgi:hypothetical protein